MNTFFDSKVVENHPEAAGLRARAWESQFRVEAFIVFCLFMLVVGIILHAWKSPISNSHGGVGHGDGVAALYVTLAAFTSFGLAYCISEDPRMFIFWKAPVPEYGPIVREIRAVAKEVLRLENPESIFGLNHERITALGEDLLTQMAVRHLVLEEQITKEVRSPELLAACKGMLDRGRKEMGKVYDRLVAARMIIRRDKALGYFFEVAQEKLPS